MISKQSIIVIGPEPLAARPGVVLLGSHHGLQQGGGLKLCPRKGVGR